MSLHRLATQAAALGLAAFVTLTTLSMVDTLAVEQHAAAAMAKAASAAAQTAAKAAAPKI